MSKPKPIYIFIRNGTVFPEKNNWPTSASVSQGDVFDSKEGQTIKVVPYSALEAANTEIEKLKLNNSIKRCGMCGNIGMTSAGLHYTNDIDSANRELREQVRNLREALVAADKYLTRADNIVNFIGSESQLHRQFREALKATEGVK